MKVYIVGAGPGHDRCLTGEARDALRRADMLIATPRLYESLKHLNAHAVCCGLAELASAVMEVHGKTDDRDARGSCLSVAVLVSGDTGFFSASAKLYAALKDVPGLEVFCLNGISSLQYLCARAGVPYETVRVMSVHGRGSDGTADNEGDAGDAGDTGAVGVQNSRDGRGSIIPFVCYNPLVFALSGGKVKAHDLVKDLVTAGLGEVFVTVGENLSAPDERIVQGSACDLMGERFGDLASVLVQNSRVADRYGAIPDQSFIRGKVPMTKQAVRTLAVAALGLKPQDRVLDIGAGTGAVAVAMAREVHEGCVYAVERRQEALELLNRNRLKFRTFNMHIIEGNAPDCLASLPKIDKAFIGGSGGSLTAIINSLSANNPGMGIVITAVTLETLHEAAGILAKAGYLPEISCINAAVAEKKGAYHLMKAENPVYIISGEARGK